MPYMLCKIGCSVWNSGAILAQATALKEAFLCIGRIVSQKPFGIKYVVWRNMGITGSEILDGTRLGSWTM